MILKNEYNLVVGKLIFYYFYARAPYLEELFSYRNGVWNMIDVDTLITKTCIDDKWVIARPVKDSRLLERMKDAFQVLLGKADAVKYYKQ